MNMRNAAIKELEFLQGSGASIDEFNELYQEILNHARDNQNYDLLREARLVLFRQVKFVTRLYREELTAELQRLYQAQQN